MKTFLIFILSILFLASFSQTPTTVRVADKPLYEQYVKYCDRMVKDTVLMVGYETIPWGTVTYVNNYTFTNPDGSKVVRTPGKYTVVKRTLNTSKYNNQLRKRTYKNVPKKVTTVPTISATRRLYWFPVVYECKQRKRSVRDFYEWYYPLTIKPK